MKSRRNGQQRGQAQSQQSAESNAQQLTADDEHVAVLALLETYNEKASERPLPRVAPLYHAFQDVGYHLANLFSMPTRDTPRFLFHKTRVAIRRLQALGAIVATLKQVFPVVEVWTIQRQPAPRERKVFVVAAGDRPTPEGSFIARSPDPAQR